MSHVRGRRWDTDERGRGVADAAGMAGWVDELRELATTADWVAEEPEAHLLPHLERLIGGEPELDLAGTRVSNGVLELDLELRTPASPREVRELGYRLVSAVGEGVTFIREVGDHEISTFEVVTGTPAGTTEFATHGHTLSIRIRSGRDGNADPSGG